MEAYIWIIGGAAVLVFLLILSKKTAGHANGFPDRENFVPKELLTTAVAQNEMLRTELQTKELEIRELSSQLAAQTQELAHLSQDLEARAIQTHELQKQFKTEFENIANRLLEEKSQRFTEQNARQLQQVLTPLREKIREFEENVDRKFTDETREKALLRREIEQLHELNQQISTEANNLASALKGQNKVQGDWGEFQLELLLEKSGLQRGVHFLTQVTMQNDEGQAKRPDFILQLPDNKQLILDSKVSLTAFERYYNDNDPLRREQHLRAHVASLRSHIDNLSRTNYQMLYQINTPDYLFLFIPLEGALNAAMQADPRLYADAMERNIVLVTTSSLIATLRTVAHLWKQEKQNRSVLEIARQSGLLYDKFVSFVEDLRQIGQRLDHARTAYDEAMNKLVSATRPGDTLIGKAEKIRELGARATKTLPPELLQSNEGG